MKRIAGQRERAGEPLRTTNISSSGVLFLYPQRIEPGTPIAIEVCLVDRPFGRGTVKMTTEAHVVRAEPALRPGWHSLAATFDDIVFYPRRGAGSVLLPAALGSSRTATLGCPLSLR